MKEVSMIKNITGFFVKKKDKNEKRKLSTFETLLIIVILGIIIILAGSYLAKPAGSKDTMKNASSMESPEGKMNQSDNFTNSQDIVADIERRLSELLSKVEGAGKVIVMIFADTGGEQVPAYNNELDTRNQERTDGKSSEISETRQLVLSGNEEPIILKVIIPQIQGVVVVAEGADDILIKTQLNNAVCTLLGIPEHRVQILKHK
jgi:stage III sporulation protein AG